MRCDLRSMGEPRLVVPIFGTDSRRVLKPLVVDLQGATAVVCTFIASTSYSSTSCAGLVNLWCMSDGVYCEKTSFEPREKVNAASDPRSFNSCCR